MSKTAREIAHRLQSYADPSQIPEQEIERVRSKLIREEYFDGSKLKALREQRQLTRISVARATHIAPTSYGRIERGKMRPLPHQAEAIIKYFGVERDYFIAERSRQPVASKTFVEQSQRLHDRTSRYGARIG